MSDRMQGGMAEAMRLMQEGDLTEATAVIQRTLGGSSFGSGSAPVASPDVRSGADEPIEVESSVVEEDPRPGAANGPAAGRGPAAATRPASDPPLLFGSLPLTMPDSVPLTMPEGLPGLPGMPGAMPSPKEVDTDPAVVPVGGRFIERSYTNRAGTRSYKLYIPSGYIGQEVSLIVMLHGCTQSPDDIAAGTQMNLLAEEHIFLVAYPAQAQGANMNKCWNWFKASDQQREQGEPSLVAGITRQVIDEYNVADGRVYVAGMSAGGAMAAIMAETYPDLYAAVGIHSGLAPGAAHDMPSAFAAMHQGGPATPRRDIPTATATGQPARAVPAIVFHGDRDKTVHPRNADNLLEHYCTAKTTGIQDEVRGSKPLGTVRQGQVPGGHAYTRATYRDSGGRDIVERWAVHGLGHAWSGGGSSGSYTDPKGPDASAEMVRFFNEHPQRGPIGQATY
ncbi:MAG TPA: PHB depolymerase family esterase [Rubrobacteraceae bacterium]|nr:PHB depolymerase family esterase [Rubrobacteraceae bacterium]